jgi:hypothetical protein
VSDAAADVQRFHLSWNGNVFRVAWTEVQNGRLRHLQRALAVPRVAGSGRYDVGCAHQGHAHQRRHEHSQHPTAEHW